MMITNIIVVTVSILGLAFLLARFVRPDIRDRIERPKHGLLERLERYDRACRKGASER